MTSSTSTTEHPPADKAMLYCPDCGHESDINGDWMLHVFSHSLTYECPKCESTIESRRNHQELSTGSDGTLRFTVQH